MFIQLSSSLYVPLTLLPFLSSPCLRQLLALHSSCIPHLSTLPPSRHSVCWPLILHSSVHPTLILQPSFSCPSYLLLVVHPSLLHYPSLSCRPIPPLALPSASCSVFPRLSSLYTFLAFHIRSDKHPSILFLYFYLSIICLYPAPFTSVHVRPTLTRRAPNTPSSTSLPRSYTSTASSPCTHSLSLLTTLGIMR